jgi:hypothetical protein
MRVPAGSYVLTQTSAPAGLAPMDPVAFRLASGGQTATVAVVNEPAALPAPPPRAATVRMTDAGAAGAPPVETAAPYTPPAPARVAAPVTAPLGGTIVRIVRAPGDTLRLLARSLIEAAAWIASIALLLAAFGAVRRRIRTTALIAGGMGSRGESS